MNTPAMRMISSNMSFRLIDLRWYPDATVSSLSASLTSVAMRSTL